MPPRRALGRMPSNSGELHPFQRALLKEASSLVSDCQAQRKSLLGIAQDYENTCKGPSGKDKFVDDHVRVLCATLGYTESDAVTRVRSLYEPGDPTATLQGVRSNFSPFIFTYVKESMWRGTPGNPLIAKLMRSIISSGFRGNSVVESRTLHLRASEDMPDMVSFHLLLGDGSARATAACLVWTLLVKMVDSIPCAEPVVSNIVASLLDIKVNFEVYGDGSSKQALLAQVALQNQAAAVQPCSTLQWIGMARDFTGLPIGDHVSNSSQLQKTLDEMVNAYNARPEVEAYVEEALPARKKRRGKNNKALEEDDGRDQGLKIGRKRLMAMKNFLAGASEEGWMMLERHVCVMGDYKLSVVTDDILLQKHIYINSKLPKEYLPTETELALRESVSETSLKIIPAGAARAELEVNPTLTPEQFLIVLHKVIHTYEAAIEGLDSDESKSKHRPNEEDWIRARIVIQMWDTTIREVGKKDLGDDDFEVFKKLILESNQLDKELCNIRNRWGKWFHMGLLPQLVSDSALSVDESVQCISAIQREAEVSLLKVFRMQLESDWKLVDKMVIGMEVLKELQAWRGNQHRREQAKIGESLVNAFCAKHFPACEVSSWERVPPQVSLILRALPPAIGATRAIIILDFNCPGSRDTLRMNTMIQAAASCCKILGPGDTIVLAWMPNCSKEGSDATAFEDEITIVNLLAASGFKHQERIRMLLDMPPSLAAKVSTIDWFVDGRLCWLPSESENFWASGSELARTRTVREIPSLPEPSDLLEVSALDANQDLNTSLRLAYISSE